MAKRSNITIEAGHWDARAKVDGIANAIAEMLAHTIGEQDPALLAMLHKELRTIREWIIGNKTHPKKIFDKLQDVRKQIVEYQHKGVQNAAEKMQEQAAEFADTISLLEARHLEAIANEREIRRRTIKPLTETQIENMLAYKPFVDGKTIGQWFGDLEYKNAERIFQGVQQGVINGLTLNSIMQIIRGKQENGFTDGVLAKNKGNAEILARTAINAVANQTRLEMYQDNADVIDGVKWLATLYHRACMICGALDGTVWKPDKLSEAKVPPAHPQCRCVLIPYIDFGDPGTRPAEAENFDLLAKERHDAEVEKRRKANPKAKVKEYDDLSYEYRRKLRYQAIADYGKDKAYKQVPNNTTFADYLQTQSESFQKEWLGARRYDMYKTGKLPLEYMVKPDTGFKRTVKDLKESFTVDNAERDGWSNSFREKVAQIKDYNSTQELVIVPEMEAAIRENGFRDVDAFVSQVNQYVKSNDILHRCKLRDILEYLADEPVLKNQFETGSTNSGFLSSEGRRLLERVVSGGKSDNMMHRERPIYGYVNKATRTAKSVDSYGDTTVVFKDSVRDRTTFTLGNSTSQQGAFCDDVRAVFSKDRQNEFAPKHIGTVPNMIGKGAKEHSAEFYVESQVWGSADLRKDVKEIAIGIKDLNFLANNVESGHWKRFMSQMDSASVRIVHYASYTAEQIKAQMLEWERLQADAKKLGIPIINLAR